MKGGLIKNKMKKLMKKKVNVFGKSIPVFAIVLMSFAIVSAALIPYFGQITGLVTVSQGLTVDGLEYSITDITDVYEGFTSLETKMITSGGHLLENGATVPATVYLNTVCSSNDACAGIDITTDTVGLSTTWSWVADAFADVSLSGDTVTLIADKAPTTVGPWISSEARIVIDAEDVGVTTLNDLLTMSWNVDVVSGYIAHVDVLIDTTGDGLADDALVFEYAKKQAPFDNVGSYPTGNSIDTFGDKGILDGTSFAWLTTEDAGAVGDPGYTAYTLADWKSGQTSSKHSKNIPANVAVIRFEIEVDGWDQTHDGAVAESHISNIVINAESVEIATLLNPVTVNNGGSLAFYVNSDFPKMLKPDIYTITTTVDDEA